MKKTITAILTVMMFCVSAHAFTTCLRNNSYFQVFKKNTNATVTPGTNPTVDSTNKTWKVVFDYITITGYASCNEISGTTATPKTNLVTGASDTGTHCWCEMWPVEAYGFEGGPTSYWIYLQSYANASTCASDCTSDCASAVASNTTFRSAVHP